GARVTVTGTAADTGGGVVAGVEISTDGGTSWHPATGTTSWSYSWVVHGSPTATILTRAADASGDLEAPSAGVTVNVAWPCSIWGTSLTPGVPNSGDTNAVELGLKFRTDTFGTITGVRFYKSSQNTGTHVGNLWTASGQLLARATFTGETSSGGQSVTFPQPVPVLANTTYVASYFAPAGHYSQDEAALFPHPAPMPDGNNSVDSAPLHALRNTPGTPNGVYGYASTSTFPTSSFNAENYWVDPVYVPAPPPGQATNVLASAGNAAAALTWNAPTSGGPVTSYIVTPYIGTTPQTPTTITGTPAPTTAIVTGLTNGTTYTFTVTASNPNGNGPASPASNAVTPSSAASLVQNGGFESALTFWS